MWFDDKEYLNKEVCLKELMKLKYLAKQSDSKFITNNYVYVISAEVYDKITSELEFTYATGYTLFGIKVIIDYYDTKDFKILKEVD